MEHWVHSLFFLTRKKNNHSSASTIVYATLSIKFNALRSRKQRVNALKLYIKSDPAERFLHRSSVDILRIDINRKIIALLASAISPETLPFKSATYDALNLPFPRMTFACGSHFRLPSPSTVSREEHLHQCIFICASGFEKLLFLSFTPVFFMESCSLIAFECTSSALCRAIRWLSVWTDFKSLPSRLLR